MIQVDHNKVVVLVKIGMRWRSEEGFGRGFDEWALSGARDAKRGRGYFVIRVVRVRVRVIYSGLMGY